MMFEILVSGEYLATRECLVGKWQILTTSAHDRSGPFVQQVVTVGLMADGRALVNMLGYAKQID